MSTIESVSNETRIFAPPAGFVAQANVKRADFDALNAAAAKDFTGFWAKLAQDELAVEQAVHADARRVERAVLQVVRRRRSQRLLQLPRPQPRERQCRQGRDHLRGRRRQRHARHLQGAAPARLPLRQRAEAPGHQEGRPRPRLHADVDRGRRGDAGMRAHRRDAFGRVRRVFGEIACRSGSSTPAPSRSSPPTSRRAAASTCRSRPSSTRRSRWAAARPSAA